MFEMLKNWYQRRFSDPQAVALLAMLIFGFAALYFFNHLLAPLLIAIVLAYLLEYPINFLDHKLRFPRLLSIIIMLGGVVGLAFLMFFVLIPSLWAQLSNLLSDLPNMFNKTNAWVLSLPNSYPDLIDYQMVETLFSSIKNKIMGMGESALKFSIASLLNLVSLGIYAFLVPLMVFFLLKDKTDLTQYVTQYVPRNRDLITKVWNEMQQQIANYIRGKLFEILLMTVVTYVIFLLFGLNYPLLLAVAVGISVLVPYVGIVIVAIPVALVAFFQFGATPIFWYLMLAFIISQIIDGNVVVPFLFSEAVNLHPLTIIVSVLIFGGLWGFWGVFFAIPLATLVKAVVHSWPSTEDIEKQQPVE